MKNQKGFSLIELLVVVIIIAIIAAIAIPSLLASRRAANEASAIAALRTIHGANNTYLTTAGTGLYGTLAQMGTANVLDDDIGNAVSTRNGYTFTDGQTPTANLFCTLAAPTTQGTSGVRRFGINQEGAIKFDSAAAITCANDASFTLSGAVLDQ